MHVVVGVVERRDLGRARLAGEQRPPRGRHVVAERADHAQPGDDHTSTTVAHASHPQSAVDEQYLARDERGVV